MAKTRPKPASATGSSPPRWPSATASSSAGSTTTRANVCRKQAPRLLPVAGVPHRPAADRFSQQSRHHRADARRRLPTSTSTSTRCARSSRTRPLAMAASAGWRPASWKAWRRWSIAAHGYGIRYDHGLFRQVIKDGWQQEYPGGLAVIRQPVGVRAARHQLPDRLRRHGRGSRRPTARCAQIWHPGRDGRGGGLRHARGRLARPACEHAAAVVGARARSAAAGCVQPRRLCRRAGDQVRAPIRSRKLLYPSDETPAGQELRLRQEFFFASASLQDLMRRHLQQHGDIAHAGRQGRHPAQRYAPGDRRARADAHSWSMFTACPGRSLGYHPARRSPTPTTRCCPRRWKAGRCR